MRNKDLIVHALAFGTVAVLMVSSAFAETRPPQETWRGEDREWNRRDDRRHERSDRRTIRAEGRVRDVRSERDGYRVRLERDDRWYHVPASMVRARGAGALRVGMFVLFDGWADRSGRVRVTSADWRDARWDRRDRRDGRYGRDSLIAGIVERIDRDRGVLLLREAPSERTITVHMPRRDRRSRGIDFDDIRRGDRVTFAGEWRRNGTFEAEEIERLRSR